jgi:hypothetical protein
VLLVERGDYLPYERQNWEPAAVFGKGRYKNAESWYDPGRQALQSRDLLLRRR